MHRAPPRRALACLLSAAPPSLQAYAASSAALRLSGYPDERAGQATRAGRGEAAPRVWGLDAEMVRTTRGEEIAWLALVEWRDAKTDAPFDWTSDRPYRVVTRLNLYIQPEGEILDLLTPYSGLRAEDLRGVTRRLGAARDALLTHLRAEDYLCGHGLDHDLHALDLYHPRILDTALIYPHPEGPPALHALSALALTHLGLEIQRDGHSPAEDASTALTLLKRALDEGAPPLQWRALPAEATGAFEALSLSEALRHLEIPDAHVRCAFLRGSRATQTAGQRPDGGPSDWDLVLVVEAAARPIEDLHLRYGDIDAALYDVPAFRRLLRRCTIWALECVYAPPHAILREEIGFKAELARDLRALPREAFSARLRQSVMYEAGRQWSKAKRDLERRGSPYQCRKRIFIALRFLTYGVEVAQSYEIKDIRCLNALWFEALRDDPSPTWAALDARYGPRYRALQAQLRAAAPQAPRYGGLKAPRRDLKPQEAARAALRAALPVCPPPPIWERAALRTQAALRAHRAPLDALDALRRRFNIGVRHHEATPSIVQLRYTPQSTPRDHPIVRECRGLILDAAQGWACLAEPFHRFFNLSEPEGQATPLDWGTARVFDKLDGSLAILYAYQGAWHVASSRRPDASGLMCLRDPQGPEPFHALFWRIWRAQGYRLPPLSRTCYLFELTTPKHAIVVRYAEERLHLIGARALVTHQELDPVEIAAAMGWRAAPRLDLRGALVQAAPLQAAAATLDAATAEGYVVQDAAWRRVKIKSPEYSRRAWLAPICPNTRALSLRHLLRVIDAGEQAALLDGSPRYAPALRRAEARRAALVATIEAAYAALAIHAEPRAFAEAALKAPFSGALFAMRRAGLSADEALRRYPIKKRARLIERVGESEP